MSQEKNIFQKMLAGGLFRQDDPGMTEVWEFVFRTIKLSPALNASASIEEIRTRLSDIIGHDIDKSTVVFTPFYTNFGRHIRFGKNVFINHACTFLDLGGIIVEDHVQIGPRVSLITENHPVDPSKRKPLI